jgi:Tol biopolymer transport system component
MTTHDLERSLRDMLRDELDAERGPHPDWAGSPAAQAVIEPLRNRWLLRAMAATAAVLVMAVVGYALLPGAPWLARTGAPPFGPARNGVIAISQGGDILVADRPGGETRPLVIGPEDDWSPKFSPDGLKLAFQRDSDRGTALMVADADGTDVVQILPESRDQERRDSGFGAWTFAPDGRSIVALAPFDDGRWRYVIRPLDPAQPTTVVSVPAPSSGMYREPPLFRPTDPGELLVLGQRVPNGPRVLFVYELATGARRTIVEEPVLGTLLNIAWFPDGEHIVYTVGGEGTYVVTADGSGDRPAEELNDRESPLSNDGTRFVAGRGGAGRDARLVLTSIDGAGAPVELECGAGWGIECPWSWTWSPDDSTLIGIRPEGEHPLGESYWQVDPETGRVSALDWRDVGVPAWQRLAP